VPSTSEIAVAARATPTDVAKACCSPVFWRATPHQCRLNPTGGHAGVSPALTEYTKIKPIGT
jgi:hypothetical protein